MNIFESLREDHDLQRKFVSDLVDTEGQSESREKLFAMLKEQLDHHAKFEERYFYKPLMGHDLTQEKSRHSVAEHKELDDIVEKLSTLDMNSSAWLSEAKHLEDRLKHHLEEEEREVFQLAGKSLTEKQKVELGENYRESMRESYS